MLKEVTEQTKDVRIHGFFDFGRDAFSTLEIDLTAPFPENIEIVVGEVAENGKILHTPGFRTFIQRIIRTGTGKQTIRFDIPTHIPAYGGFPHCLAPAEAGGEVAPFRYVEVNRHYGPVTVRRTAWFGDWDDRAADFRCDDPILNGIWDFCRYSIKATSVFDKYVDGERERMPYEGDAYIDQLGHFCCDAHYTLAKNTIDHFFEFGEFTWPTEWNLLTPLLIRDYLLYSGDTASAAKWLPALDAKLMPEMLDEEGLLSPQKYRRTHPESRVRDLIDWPESERDGYEYGEVNFVPNAYLLRALAAMHELTGNEEYLTRAERLRRGIREHFRKDGLFVDAVGSAHTGVHSAVFALWSGAAQGDEIGRLCSIIREKGMACSVFAAQFLLEVCFGYGMADHGLALMVSDGPRSWRNMLREGSTISMESWGDQVKPNQDWNHAWGAAPANIITRHLCGIRPVEPGFRTFEVMPKPGRIREFSVRQPTIHGSIELCWKNGEMRLTVPEKCSARLADRTLPAGEHCLTVKP